MRLHFRIGITIGIIIFGSAFLCAQSKTAAKKQVPQKAIEPAITGSFDGIRITESQLRAEAGESLENIENKKIRDKAMAAQSEYNALKSALERIIEDKLLAAEASKKGISKEELLDQEIKQKAHQITPGDIDKFYEDNKERIDQPKELVLEQISEYLKKKQDENLRTSLIARLEKDHKILRFIQPYRFTVKPEGRPTTGSPAAPISLILFSDFQCPHCKAFEETLKKILKNYEGKVRLTFRQFPLIPIHSDAKLAAKASICAVSQGRFWQMHDLMFDNQDKLKIDDLKQYAKQIGLNESSFLSCLDSKETEAKIREDLKAGASAGVDGTPALFINGRSFYGNYPYQDIAEVIEEELAPDKSN